MSREVKRSAKISAHDHLSYPPSFTKANHWAEGTAQLLCPFSGCTVSGGSLFFHFFDALSKLFHWDSRDAVGRTWACSLGSAKNISECDSSISPIFILADNTATPASGTVLRTRQLRSTIINNKHRQDRERVFYMNEITIAVKYDNDNPTVSGQELHKALMISWQQICREPSLLQMLRSL